MDKTWLSLIASFIIGALSMAYIIIKTDPHMDRRIRTIVIGLFVGIILSVLWQILVDFVMS
jgi:hypothetical protein